MTIQDTINNIRATRLKGSSGTGGLQNPNVQSRLQSLANRNPEVKKRLVQRGLLKTTTTEAGRGTVGITTGETREVKFVSMR